MKWFVPVLVQVVCWDLSEHRVGLDAAADMPSAFPGLVSGAGQWPYPFQIQLDFSFPHSNL